MSPGILTIPRREIERDSVANRIDNGWLVDPAMPNDGVKRLLGNHVIIDMGRRIQSAGAFEGWNSGRRIE